MVALRHTSCSACRSARAAGYAISPPLKAEFSFWLDPQRLNPAPMRSIGGTEKAKIVEPLAELTQFAPKRKPEALLPLDKSGTKLRVLIIFDSDENGAPTPVEVLMPSIRDD